MNSSMEYSLNITGGLASDKLGVTTTVKEQVENIELALETFKRAVDTQKKSQNELQLQLKKLDEKTHKEFEEMLQETTVHASQLSDTFKNENYKQNKQFEYMELQGGVLTDQHEKLKEIGQEIGYRTGEIEKKVGV